MLKNNSKSFFTLNIFLQLQLYSLLSFIGKSLKGAVNSASTNTSLSLSLEPALVRQGPHYSTKAVLVCLVILLLRDSKPNDQASFSFLIFFFTGLSQPLTQMAHLLIGHTFFTGILGHTIFLTPTWPPLSWSVFAAGTSAI